MEQPISVALADEHLIYREGIKVTLKKYKDIKIIWEAQDNKALLNNLMERVPDVLCIDATHLSETIKLLKILRKEYQGLKIIVLSLCDEKDTITRIMDNGANAFLNKTTTVEEIHTAIVTCWKENFYFNEMTNNAMLHKLKQKSSIRRLYPIEVKFNQKELEVLKLMGEDKITGEIAKEVFASVRTVENIRQNMKSKVNAKTIGGLLMYALRNKLIE